MGSYLNPSNKKFFISRNSEIYVDKSELIAKTNLKLNTQQQFMCVSRPRRFGKSMGMDMLAAYYAYGVDSAHLFDDLKIAKDPSYHTHLNQYNVVKINMQMFLSSTKDMDAMLAKLQKNIIYDILDAYEGQVRFRDETDFIQVMMDVFAKTERAFIVLIDEWDCIFREYQKDTEAQRKYLDFLRLWMKDQDYIALAYMTGILPIKKYGTHSALNMFTEYSMMLPRELAPYFGFTEEEVQALCTEYEMPFEEAKSWYDGYRLMDRQYGDQTIYSMYSPKSMVDAMLSKTFDTYWNKTETYEALKIYIEMNYDGLKDAVVEMLGGGSVPINTGSFINDMTTFGRKDDVLTLLVHLGYLSYNWEEKTVRIPNKEVATEFVTAIEMIDSFSEVARSVEASKKLLEALIEGDEEAVAKGVDQAHDEIAILKYNDENSLVCCINLAFYYAKEYYTIIRELPTGKGFADICLIPRKKFAHKPAVVIELKKDLSAEGAIAQIKNKEYVKALEDYHGNLVLCGINYDSKTKKHSCKIQGMVY